MLDAAGLIRQGGAGVAIVSDTLPVSPTEARLASCRRHNLRQTGLQLTSAHSIDRLNGLIDYPTQRL